MGAVHHIPIRLKHQICRDRMGSAVVAAEEVQCPRIGECLCIPERTRLELNLSRAQAALDAYDGRTR